MKIIYTIIAVVALLGSLCSCLDENPRYTQNNGIVFTDEDNVQLALNGCYSYMASTNVYGQMMQETLLTLGGHSYGLRNGQDVDLLPSINVNSTVTHVEYLWDGLYKVISETNAFIENVESSEISESSKLNFINEAKFIRALSYLNLTTLYGDVPLKTVASTSEGIATPRSPQEDVFEQIIADFTDAMNMSRTTPVDGYACSWTAEAYLAKAYHKMAKLGINSSENLQNAKTHFDNVYNSGVFALESDFNDLFGTWVTGSPEAIFQVNFYSDASTGYYNRGSNRLCPNGSTTGINWTTFAYSFSGYDLHELAYPGDPRMKTTFLTQWRSYNGNNQSSPIAQVGDVLSPNDSSYAYPYRTYTVEGDYIVDGTLRQHVVRLPYDDMPDRKVDVEYLNNYPLASGADAAETARVEAIRSMVTYFTQAGTSVRYTSYGKPFDQYQSAQAANKNLMVYRYAEFLLLMADVYNELGDGAGAVSLVNQVLARARNSNGGSSTGQPEDWDSSLSQDELRTKLYYERIFELSGEPTYWDMTRIGGIDLLREFLQFHNDHQLVQAGNEYYNESNITYTERLYNDGDLTDEYLTKILLLPLPQSEIDGNSSITENNPGY